MCNERLKARLRLREPEITHLRVPGSRNAYCGSRKPWERVLATDEADSVTCTICRSLARVRAAQALAAG